MSIGDYKKQKGAAAVEFAIILPIMLVLVFGIVQFGFILNGIITITSAAREGARLAVVNTDDELVKNRVEDTSVGLLLKVERNDIVVNREIGDGKLSVTVDGNVDVIVPLLGIAIGDSFPLSSECIMRIEQEN